MSEFICRADGRSDSSESDMSHRHSAVVTALATSTRDGSLDEILLKNGIVVEHRSTNVYESSFGSEVLTLQLPSSESVQVFCKYSDGSGPLDRHLMYEHRRGVLYEAQIYQLLLNELPLRTAHYVGHLVNGDGSCTLVLEYLKNAMRVTKVASWEELLRRAMHWLARFHTESEQWLLTNPQHDVTVYDASYYWGWIKRTQRFVRENGQPHTWIDDIAKRSGTWTESLVSAPKCVIHGEFFPHNLLAKGMEIIPIDWESAAIGPAEIDIAAITHKWPRDVATEMHAAYASARWPEGAPRDFKYRLKAASLYFAFRWMGDRASWTATDSNIQNLRDQAVGLALL